MLQSNADLKMTSSCTKSHQIAISTLVHEKFPTEEKSVNTQFSRWQSIIFIIISQLLTPKWFLNIFIGTSEHLREF